MLKRLHLFTLDCLVGVKHQTGSTRDCLAYSECKVQDLKVPDFQFSFVTNQQQCRQQDNNSDIFENCGKFLSGQNETVCCSCYVVLNKSNVMPLLKLVSPPAGTTPLITLEKKQKKTHKYPS